MDQMAVDGFARPSSSSSSTEVGVESWRNDRLKVSRSRVHHDEKERPKFAASGRLATSIEIKRFSTPFSGLHTPIREGTRNGFLPKGRRGGNFPAKRDLSTEVGDAAVNFFSHPLCSIPSILISRERLIPSPGQGK